VIGYGLTGDAYHITAPPEDSDGTNRCMRMALEDARIDPAEVDYVNAHGTATSYNDGLESRSIRSVFGAHADRLAVSSTKSMTGHPGRGGRSNDLSTLALREQFSPRSTSPILTTATSTTCRRRSARKIRRHSPTPSVSAGQRLLILRRARRTCPEDPAGASPGSVSRGSAAPESRDRRRRTSAPDDLGRLPDFARMVAGGFPGEATRHSRGSGVG
jgi:hypothetical protein